MSFDNFRQEFASFLEEFTFKPDTILQLQATETHTRVIIIDH